MSRILWQTGAQSALALTALLLVSVGRPHPRLPWLLAVPAGALAAAGLFVLLAGARPPLRVPPRERTPALVTAVGLLTCAAASEEVIWRRLVLGGLSAVAGTVPAWFASTVGFAFSHAGAGLRSVGVHLLTGGAFGFLYAATGSLAAAVVAHAVYNSMIALAIDSERPRRPPGEG